MDSLTEMLNAEQAAHIAQLQLRNQILQIGTLIWAALLLGWLIYSFIKFYKALRLSLLSSKSAIHFQCTKCNTDFLIPTDFLIKHPFMPKKTFTVSTPMIGFTSSIQRKLHCPCCNQKVWCKQSMSESYKITIPAFLNVAKKQLPRFLIVTFGLLFAGALFTSVINMIFS